MKKRKKLVISVLIIAILLVVISVVIYRLLQDKNKLTVEEKQYITSNANKLINVNVINNSNVFANEGEGVYYDFLEGLEDDRHLSFNIVSTASTNDTIDISLAKGNILPDESKIFYTDHYVLVSKTINNVFDLSDINAEVGVMSNDKDFIINNLGKHSFEIKNYDSRSDLTTALENDEVTYILVPRLEFLDYVLDKLYAISYHFTDLKDYYYISNGASNELNSIFQKYYNTWKENSFEKSFYENEYSLFVNKLKITEKELDVLNKKSYKYGYVPYSPYDSKRGKAYGGITSVYLKEFTKFSGMDIKFIPYKNYQKFVKAISKSEVDLYMNYYNFDSSYATIDSNYQMEYAVVMNNADRRSFTSLDSIKNEEVYVKENSLLAKYLTGQKLKIKLYSKDKEIKKLLKKNNIVAMDKYNYMSFKDTNDLDISYRFEDHSSTTYNFKSNADTMFNRLFTYFVNVNDKNEIIYMGLEDSRIALKSGNIIYNITRYTALIILLILLGSFIVYKYGKKVRLKKRIRKADKIKYIDLLTSLKNRNFLHENMSIWNRNTVYPQAIIVADLNGVQALNDSYGYEAGDKQIKAIANILIKTQLDNSEIMRTDGNEFTIYLVGYNEKRVLSYIKKLNKAFKDLPYDKGVAIGFSMIEDDLKLVDDAINEATEKMKNNKVLMQGDANEKEN